MEGQLPNFKKKHKEKEASVNCLTLIKNLTTEPMEGQLPNFKNKPKKNFGRLCYPEIQKQQNVQLNPM